MSAEDLNAIKPPANATTQRLDQAMAARQRLGIPDNNPQPIPTSRISTKVKVSPTTTVVLPKTPDAPKPNRIPLVGKLPKAPKALGVLGFLPAVGPLLDAGDTYAGTQQAITGETGGDRLAGTFQAIGGAAGLASLSPIAPVAAPLSLGAGLLAAATQRRADMDKPKVRHTYTGPTPTIVPTRPPSSKPIGNNGPSKPNSKPIGNGKGGVSKPVGDKPKAAPPAPKPIADAMALLKQGWKFIQGGK
jgi:hypothetical protein